MINTKRFNDPKKFFAIVNPYLLLKETENNLALGVLNSCLTEPPDPTHLFIVSENKGEVVLVMIQTGKRLILSGEIQYIDTAVDFLFTKGIKLNGIIAQSNLGKSFATKWAEKTGVSLEIEMNQRIYRLDQVNEIQQSKGKIRIAQEKDKRILVKWIKEFSEEMGELLDEQAPQETLDKYLKEGSLYVWEDAAIVSMVRKARATQNGIVVTYVYTPGEYRNKGYASTCVSEFSKILLKEYEFWSLYTDQSNPTSNGIYEKIGYKPVVDSIVINFK